MKFPIALALAVVTLLPTFSCAVFVRNPAPEHLSAQPPKQTLGDRAFAVVAIPDTQYYTAQVRGGEAATFELQTQWCALQKDALNVRYIAHLGDVTDFGFLDEEQFERSRRAWDTVVRSKIPWTILPGNHEAYGVLWTYSKDNLSTYSRYFPASLASSEEFFGGSFPEGTLENSYVLFEAGGLSWIGLAIGCLGYNGNEADSRAVGWANEVLSRYPDRHAIVSTHNYLYEGGYDQAGLFLWESCLRKHDNVFLVICGHHTRQYRQVSYTDGGKPVLECLSDYQYDPRGGDGWIRYYHIDPQNRKLYARTYSVLSNLYDTSPQGQFEHELPF